jgi:hypothetical protein
MADSPNGARQPALDPELAALQAKAELAQQQVKAAIATVTSADGSTTVQVGPNGSLLDLRFAERAYQRPPHELAAMVMQLAAKGQQQVSAKIMDAFSGLVGENSKAMEVLTEFLPADPDAGTDDPDEESARRWGAIEQSGEPGARPPVPPTARPASPAARPTPRTGHPTPPSPQSPQPWSGGPAQQPPRRSAPRPQPRRPRHDDQDDDFQQPW